MVASSRRSVARTCWASEKKQARGMEIGYRPSEHVGRPRGRVGLLPLEPVRRDGAILKAGVVLFTYPEGTRQPVPYSCFSQPEAYLLEATATFSCSEYFETSQTTVRQPLWHLGSRWQESSRAWLFSPRPRLSSPPLLIAPAVFFEWLRLYGRSHY